MADQEKQDTTKGPNDADVRSSKPRRRRVRRRRPSKPLPPWKVILHDDDVNLFDDVVQAVCTLAGLNKEEAVVRVQEADRTGSALLLVTHLERAELYVEQFASCNIMATAEPDA